MASTQLEQDFDKLSASVTQACELIDKLRSQRNDLLAIIRMLISSVSHQHVAATSESDLHCSYCRAVEILEELGSQS